MEHNLAGRMQEYPLIVIPEWNYLPEDFKKELIAFVRQGGNLLIIGPKAAALFKEQLGVSFNGEPEEKSQWLENNGHLAGIRSLAQSVKLSPLADFFLQMTLRTIFNLPHQLPHSEKVKSQPHISILATATATLELLLPGSFYILLYSNCSLTRLL